jgi:hypothetical protein
LVGSHGDKLVVVETRKEGIVDTEWNGAEAEQRVGEGLVDTEGELRVEGRFLAKETKKMLYSMLSERIGGAVGGAEELMSEGNFGVTSMFTVDHPEMVRVLFFKVG